MRSRTGLYCAIIISFSFAFLSVMGFGQIIKEDPDLFLKPTKFINSDHPLIVKKAAELTAKCSTTIEKMKNIYEFVRDSYNDRSHDSYIASDTLVAGGNSCAQRSVLLAALCRAAGIPARLHMQCVVLKDTNTAVLQQYLNKYTDVPDKQVDPAESVTFDYGFVHWIAAANIDGKWRYYEPVGNKHKWILWNQDEARSDDMPLAFNPDGHCLFEDNGKVTLKTLSLFFDDRSDIALALEKAIYAGVSGYSPLP